MNDSKILISAAWIAPMDGPPIRGGAVLFENGRISAVGDSKKIHQAYPDAAIHDVGNAVVLPGLVNAHTHLELSDVKQTQSPANLGEWILGLMKQTAMVGGSMSELVGNAVRQGVQQCLRFGVTSVGDISKQCMFSRPILTGGPLRVVSYGEIQAMATRRGLLEERFAAASDFSHESRWLRIGITPHAPYTVEPVGFMKCLEYCRLHDAPLATHLAETSDEETFLTDHAGPFRHLWEAGINAWDNEVPKFIGGPIRFAQKLGLLDYPTLLAHVNFCNDDELSILAAGNASVVYCPRTHRYFGHPPHRWRDMLSAGINVAVGTDSCASSPDLNLVDDLRLLHELAPEIPPQTLWEMAGIRGARAIQMEAQVGSLSIGKRADATVFPITTNDPLREILESKIQPCQVWIGGELTAARPASRG